MMLGRGGRVLNLTVVDIEITTYKIGGLDIERELLLLKILETKCKLLIPIKISIDQMRHGNFSPHSGFVQSKSSVHELTLKVTFILGSWLQMRRGAAVVPVMLGLLNR